MLDPAFAREIGLESSGSTQVGDPSGSGGVDQPVSAKDRGALEKAVRGRAAVEFLIRRGGSE